MQKLSISKALFDEILMKKSYKIVKKSTKYWQKELIEPFLDENDILNYKLKQIDKLELSNGLAKDNPKIIVSIKNIEYNPKNLEFVFLIDDILEQRNVKLNTDYKDLLIEELLKEREKLKENLTKDDLTKLFNRKKMDEDLKIFTNQSNSSFLSTVFIDADNFKRVNDNYGHDIGDKVLIYLAEKIKRYSGVLNATAYRYGGEEFVLFSFLNQKDLLQGLDDLRQSIKSQKIFTPKGDIQISVSMGVSSFGDTKDAKKMIVDADKALLYAKNTGKDKVFKI